MVKKFLVIFLLFIPEFSFAQNVSAKASVDTTSYLIGDFIHYRLEISYDKNIKIIPPAIQDTLKDVDILKAGNMEYSEQAGKKIAALNFLLAKYDSADVTIPAIRIFYRTGKDTLSDKGIDTSDVTLKSVVSNPVNFQVRLVKVDLKKDIKDVKDPKKIPLDWTVIILLILGGLILLALGFYFYKRYRQKKLGKPVIRKEVVIPPHIKALKALKSLEEEELWQSGEVKQYHSEITEIIRNYFAARFGLQALELTTSETLGHLKGRKDAEVIIVITENFLTNADLVKFAKFSPLSSVNEEMMKQAVDIVEKTKPEEKIKEKAGEGNV
jgi:hypothetical protein